MDKRKIKYLSLLISLVIVYALMAFYVTLPFIKWFVKATENESKLLTIIIVQSQIVGIFLSGYMKLKFPK